METLRIVASALTAARLRIDVHPSATERGASTELAIPISAHDNEDLRWYLEDYLEYPHDPAPVIADRVESKLRDIGQQLFTGIFDASTELKEIWKHANAVLNRTRVEIVARDVEAEWVPWELICDPLSTLPLALQAHSFVRGTTSVSTAPLAIEGPLRILLVICRPAQDVDVPFRSVAGRLVRELKVEEHHKVRLDALRPPTFDRLEAVLNDAAIGGRPYHIVHFDGHGVFLDPYDTGRPRGYLIFENPNLPGKQEYIHGELLGRTLAQAGIAALILNACRSAHTEAQAKPDRESGDTKVQAFGSLASEVAQAGVPGIVAMRYNIYVATATQFIANVYRYLTAGRTLSESVSRSRIQLAAKPYRSIAFEYRTLQDWCVPVVYESCPVSFCITAQTKASGLPVYDVGVKNGSVKTTLRGVITSPEIGFWGRDETLLALDRAFDSHRIVLLHGYAGSGKTATAIEFSEWYEATGGVPPGRRIFNFFGTPQNLGQLLDDLADLFSDVLEDDGIDWWTLDDCERRNKALQLLSRMPCVWIWDNVETIDGQYDETTSQTDNERSELRDFLRDARNTQAKFLLTSRRQDHSWLNGIAHAVPVPPMPMTDVVHLAQSMAQQRKKTPIDIKAWWPILKFAQGNPLAVHLVVGCALNRSITGRKQAESFVFDLRTGEDEVGSDMSGATEAAFKQALKTGFRKKQKIILSLLYLFRGFVDVPTLLWMGIRGNPYRLKPLVGQSKRSLTALLERAKDVGLLSVSWESAYSVHPLIPILLKHEFIRHFPKVDLAVRAYVNSVSQWGNYLHDRYRRGDSAAIYGLAEHEENLLYCRRSAIQQQWWSELIWAMEGLSALYEHNGRLAAWRRLVDEIEPFFVVKNDGRPVRGQEDGWRMVSHYRVRLLQDEYRWDEAEQLQSRLVNHDREVALPVLEKPERKWRRDDCALVEQLITSLHGLGDSRRGMGDANCTRSFREAYDLSRRLRDGPKAAVCAYKLAAAYQEIEAIQDLDMSDNWCRKALDACDKNDALGRARCHMLLSIIAHMKLRKAIAGEDLEDMQRYFGAGYEALSQVLAILPSDAVHLLSVAHNEMANLLRSIDQIDEALAHYRKAISYEEMQGNSLGAGQSRISAAAALAGDGRYANALDYANAALRDFRSCGAAAVSDVEEAKRLISQIRKDLSDPDSVGSALNEP